MSLDNNSTRELGKGFALFAIAFGVLVVVLSLLSVIGLPETATSPLFAVLTLAAFVGIGFTARTMDLPDFQVASRRVPAALNGMATAAAYIGSAGFLGLAGLFFAGNRAALAIVIGSVVGFLALAILVAPYLRRAAAVTVADFLAIRFGSRAVRLAAYLVTLGCSGALLVAEAAAGGQIVTMLLPIEFNSAIILFVVVVLACNLLGGMSGVTMTALAQYAVLAIAFLTPVTVLSLQYFGLPLPQLVYGRALVGITGSGDLPAIIDAGNRFLPVAQLDQFHMVVLAVCIAAGVAALPHVVTRSATTLDADSARQSVGWALFFVLIVAATAPAYGIFAQLAQRASPSATPIDAAFVALELPLIADMLPAFFSLVATGALAAVTAAASALLFAIANSTGHDLYNGLIDAKGSAGRRLIVTRVVLIGAAGLAGWYAMQASDRIFLLAATSASLAASGLFPALVLGIWWKRTTAVGALAGIVFGFAAAAGYAWMVAYGDAAPWQPLGSASPPLTPMAAGLLGLPTGFMAIVFVSLITPHPSPDRLQILDAIRHPTSRRR